MQVFYKYKNKMELIDKNLENALLPDQHQKKYQWNFFSLNRNDTDGHMNIKKKRNTGKKNTHVVKYKRLHKYFFS